MESNNMTKTNLSVLGGLAIAVLGLLSAGVQAAKPLVHDAEFYILQEQNGAKWAQEDEDLDRRLAEFREKNGGKPPNIFYILIDDIGFGDLGSKTLNVIRGYETPSINQFARDGMRMARMYTEPSCTPTRVAFMTGRQPQRNGMANTQVAITDDVTSSYWNPAGLTDIKEKYEVSLMHASYFAGIANYDYIGFATSIDSLSYVA